jgi:hypothetical protein
MGTGFPLDEQQKKESSQVYPRLKQIEKDCLLYKHSQVRIGCHIHMPIVINDRGIHAEEMPDYQEDHSTEHQWQENEKVAPQRSACPEEPTHEQGRFRANDDKTDGTNSRPEKGTCEVHSYAPLMAKTRHAREAVDTPR